MSLVMLETMAFPGARDPDRRHGRDLHGMYVIERITQNRTEFFKDGKAKKIDFTLNLKRVSEDIREKLTDYRSSLVRKSTAISKKSGAPCPLDISVIHHHNSRATAPLKVTVLDTHGQHGYSRPCVPEFLSLVAGNFL